ncbi:glycosyltransferase family 4 protein [Simiduia curdlanivorans]|uniref:glycosyltransferase family 4 protein n=1 Tax=Simiduia curdlanivorans TaxID=1492769 RepID=UPI0036D3F773
MSCFYIDGYTYQENMLVRQHVSAGHEVLVVASAETFGEDKQVTYVAPGDYIGTDGARVVRLPYRRLLPHAVMTKLRMHPGVLGLIADFAPDVIMFHGACGWELLTACKYVRQNPSVKLYVDSHEDFNNSARGPLSMALLYKSFYVPIIRAVKNHVSKFLYITYETKRFCKDVYRLEDSELEFYPLGGVVLDDEAYAQKRQTKRAELAVLGEQTLFFQSGKFDEKKRLLESLSAFSKIRAEHARFFIAGSFSDSIKLQAEALIAADSRIHFLGWANSDQLLDLLCATDVYVQPGSQSATLQMSIAARCVVIIDNVPSHQDIFRDNGFLVSDEQELYEALASCAEYSEALGEMSQRSFEFASQKLNYAVLAERLLK